MILSIAFIWIALVFLFVFILVMMNNIRVDMNKLKDEIEVSKVAWQQHYLKKHDGLGKRIESNQKDLKELKENMEVIEFVLKCLVSSYLKDKDKGSKYD